MKEQHLAEFDTAGAKKPLLSSSFIGKALKELQKNPSAPNNSYKHDNISTKI